MTGTHGMLSGEDIERIADEAVESETPGPLAATLVDAVDHGRIADQADVGYALTIAAEINIDTGDAETALALAERAIEVSELPDICHPTAIRADALFLLGRDEDAMEQLSALRERLTEDPAAPMLVSEVLVSNDRPELAEEWLTEALHESLGRHPELEPAEPDLSDDPDDDSGDAYDDAAMVTFELLQARHSVRHELGLPHDDHDDLADELLENLENAFDDDSALLFFPQHEYDEVLRRWPDLAAVFGPTWDDHRATTEQSLQLRTQLGSTSLAVIPGSADGLAEFAAQTGDDPTDADTIDAYTDSLATSATPNIPWPPGRNDLCWCGTPTKYKRCCLRRA